MSLNLETSVFSFVATILNKEVGGARGGGREDVFLIRILLRGWGDGLAGKDAYPQD